MIWRRALLLTLLAVTGIVIETAVLGGATLNGTKPELMLLFTIALAMNEGAFFGATAGFALGLATDLLIGLPAGITSLIYTAAGYGVGRVRAQVSVPTAWLPIAMVFAATGLGVLAYGWVGMLLDQAVTPGALVRGALLAAAYNALLTPFVFPLVRSLSARLRPMGVTR